MNTIHSSTRGILSVSWGALTLGILGCGSHSALVGTWRGTAPVSFGLGNAAVTYQFGADGIEQLSAKILPQKPSPANSPAAIWLLPSGVSTIHTAGTYTVKGDVLSVTTTQMTLLDAHNQPSALTPDGKNQTSTLRMQVRGDTLSLDTLDGTPPVLLTRQKAD